MTDTASRHNCYLRRYVRSVFGFTDLRAGPGVSSFLSLSGSDLNLTACFSTYSSVASLPSRWDAGKLGKGKKVIWECRKVRRLSKTFYSLTGTRKQH